MRRIITIITAATGDRVLVCNNELNHAMSEHFEFLPKEMFLELLERVLKDPDLVYEEGKAHFYHLFYKLENGKYLVAVIKKAPDGAYFSTLYTTGNRVRNKHKKLKKVII